MKYLASAFSLQMVAEGATIKISPAEFGEIVEPAEVARQDGRYDTDLIAGLQVVLGHQGACDFLSTLLERAWFLDRHLFSEGFGEEQARGAGWEEVPGRPNLWRLVVHRDLEVTRVSLALRPGDIIYVLQPVNQRLTPGTELGAEAPYQLYRVEVYP